MEATADRRATYADIEALPDHVVGEIIDGELFVSPRPAGPHTLAASYLGAALIGAFGRPRGPGGWWIFFEPELHLGDDVLVPDLAGWCYESLPDAYVGVGCEVAPQWVCEVLSPSTASRDRVRKLAAYGRLGVRHVWLVDPRAFTVEVFRYDTDRWTFVAGYDADETPVLQAEPFEAVGIPLEQIFIPGARE